MPTIFRRRRTACVACMQISTCRRFSNCWLLLWKSADFSAETEDFFRKNSYISETAFFRTFFGSDRAFRFSVPIRVQPYQKQCEALLEKEICVLCLLLLLLLSGKRCCLLRTNPLWLTDECFIFPIFFLSLGLSFQRKERTKFRRKRRTARR